MAQQQQYPRLPPSGLKVIVVGAGFGGLATAIECDRKGHSVTLFEKSDEVSPLGDIISFETNSSPIFGAWPGVVEAMEDICHKTHQVHLHHWQGKHATTQSFEAERRWGRRINGHRAEIHAIVFRHAVDRGVDVRLGHKVTDYFEDEEQAGVVVNGERVTADVVVAAEGVRSKGRQIVLGFEDRPKASGYAVYRAWFPSFPAGLGDDPLTAPYVAHGDVHVGWIGPDVHFLAASIKDGKDFSWVCTHRDDGDVDESWQFPGRVDDVLKLLEGWDPRVRAMVAATPPDRLIDYKLVFRDPLPTFVSPRARIALVGDAAHPFLPTSIQGASQSMEDGVAMAVCLEMAVKRGHDVPTAVRAWEKIRYGRVHRAQQMGVTTREQWHKADWDEIWKNPESMHLQRHEWLLNFDAEKNAYETYDEAVKDLQEKAAEGGKEDGKAEMANGQAKPDDKVEAANGQVDGAVVQA